MSDFNLSRIEKQRFRPAAEVEELLQFFSRNLVPGERYRVARLAIARSLAEAEPATPLPKGTEAGRTVIEGQTLFGEEVGVWACLIAEGAPLLSSVEEFRALVEAHWTRGAKLLQQDLDAVGGRHADFIAGLAAMAQRPGVNANQKAAQNAVPQAAGAVTVQVGEVSTDVRTGGLVRFVLNAPGVSPHLAVLGKTRSGKTRTGIVMAEQVAGQAKAPMLLIDPKGEFVNGGGLVAIPAWGGRTLADRFPGLQALDVRQQPVPLDFLQRGARMSDVEAARLAMSFKDSFGKTLRVQGDAMLGALRETVQSLLVSGTQPISLETVLTEVRETNAREGRRPNTIEAKLSEMAALQLFEPRVAPDLFFSGRWAIGLGGTTEESKRLVIFLILDALARHLLTLPDSSTDSGGHRAMRHLLVIDEAREILSYRHNALSSLVRQSAAKGGIVMLLSQSPEDFEGEDDFLSQLGSIVVFTSSTKSVKDLNAAFGQRKSAEDFSDKVLPAGVAWAKLPRHDLIKVRAWS